MRHRETLTCFGLEIFSLSTNTDSFIYSMQCYATNKNYTSLRELLSREINY